MTVNQKAVEEMAAEQGPRWRSRKEAWLDGYRHGEQQARMTGRVAAEAAQQERERIRERLGKPLHDLASTIGRARVTHRGDRDLDEAAAAVADLRAAFYDLIEGPDAAYPQQKERAWSRDETLTGRELVEAAREEMKRVQQSTEEER